MPAITLAWEPGSTFPAPTGGFSVDTSNRNDVVSFYQAIYMASEGYQNRIGWTGNYTSTAAGAEGTVSAAFADDVERRVNFYRALCGLPSDVQVNSGATVKISAGDAHVPPASTTKAAASQRSALMIIRTYPSANGLSHNPPASCIAWTAAAWNANKNGNLALGFYGPGALDAYMKEDVSGISAWNYDVGHRRWILGQRSTDFATGDTPGNYNPSNGVIKLPTNSLYVVPKPSELDPVHQPVFVSYPAAGYFPSGLNSPFWSLSYPGADFSSATVAMSDAAGNPVASTVVSKATGYGDNAIVWQVPSAAAVKTVSGDLRWNVAVSGIQGEGIPASHSYSVILMDPGRLLETPEISGPSSLLSVGSEYQIEDVPGADQMETGFFLRRSTAWTEGAEASPAPGIIDRTTGTGAGDYDLFATAYKKTGSRSFRLTFPTLYDMLVGGVPEQSFELDREILPVANPKLNFYYRRGWMTAASKLAVETSSDGGANWQSLTVISGKTNGSGDTAFVSASVNLPASVQPLRVRFRYYLQAGGSAYTHDVFPAQPTGIFIDDVTATGCHWLEPTGFVSGAGLDSFVFDSTAAGTALAAGQEWWLRPRAILGGKAFPYGPAKIATATGQADTFANWISAEYPGHDLSFEGDTDGDGLDDGIEYAFSLDPTVPNPVPDTVLFPDDRIEISRELPIQRSGVVYAAQWSEDLTNWTSQGVTIRFEGGKVVASVARGEQGRFLRWNIVPQ